MHYAEAFDRAHEFASAALQFMREAGIAATPNNYSVWYSYTSSHNNELRNTVDILQKNKRPITEDVSRQLYDEFIVDGAGSDQVVQTTERIEGSVDKVIETLESAGAYGDALRNFSGKLASGSARNVGELIAQAIQDTKHKQEQNSELMSQLARSTNTITKLREDLEAVRRESLTDALTGVGNRKSFDGTIADLAEQADETGDDLCLLLLDIDHFKKFNDTYSHQVGDQVLRLAARTLQDSVGSRDFPARYGGEEFAVLLPGKDLTAASAAADDLRVTIAAKRVVRKRTGETVAAITISGGVARYRPGEPLNDLIRRADQALYAAKAGGRNQIQEESEASMSKAAIA